MKNNIVLSIETAIAGGSLSLRRDAEELDFWTGMADISKSIDVLEQIKKILEKNNLEKRTIDKVIVSGGPGSRTGVQVGSAVGLGIKRAINCQMVVVDALKAMFLIGKYPNINDSREVIAVVPIGRNLVCRQSFSNSVQNFNSNQTASHISTTNDFLEFYEKSLINFQETFVLHGKLYCLLIDKFGHHPAGDLHLVDVGENIAGVIGKAFGEFNARELPYPIHKTKENGKI